ncbi:MAG: TIGR03663 family protein [Anaerolineales bacterium]|nr:TIGR03663 family protein [Anaerolineales bacterium]
MEDLKPQPKNWLERNVIASINLNWETALFTIIVILAVVTRFYDLEARVMSHDESLHTYYSWELYDDRGFEHTPLMHGPLQFHLVALSYFLFGDSDLTARIPAVTCSILAVVLLWNYRRYLGKAGTLIAGLLFVISPYLLYYGRYVRNEALVLPLGLLTIWSTLRYLDTGKPRYLYYLTAVTALHFTTKETSFIYTAQVLIFLGLVFLYRISRRPWSNKSTQSLFTVLLLVAAAFLVIGFGIQAITDSATQVVGDEVVTPADPDHAPVQGLMTAYSPLTLLFFGLGALSFLASLYFLVSGFGFNNLRNDRAFGAIILLLTLILPHLAAFPIRWLGWNPLQYAPADVWRSASVLVPMILIALVIGGWWNLREWLINAAIFYVLFTLFFTTFFTNWEGFFSGLVGSLGYWLEQQGVARGSQPWYYYLLIQIPVYEYLGLLGSTLAAGLGLNWLIRRNNADAIELIEDETTGELEPRASQALAILMLAFWTVSSVVAYTFAGEKMPWLTVHIAWPMLLLTGWAVGRLIEKMDWDTVRKQRGWLVTTLLLIFLIGLTGVLRALLGPNQPFQGQELTQLQATTSFILALALAGGSLAGLLTMFQIWELRQVASLLVLITFTLLSLLTARTAFTATYVNYDQANELLVYAHSARGVKDVLDRVEQISMRTTDGLAVEVAYDDDVSWPYTWYLRNYTNQRYYGANPTEDLRNAPVIIVGDNNFSKIESVVGRSYYRFDYIRMVWPNQDYFPGLIQEVTRHLNEPEMRAALFDIWLNRDYTQYGEVTGKDVAIANWSPADRMRLYIRKDVVSELWDYAASSVDAEIVADPYEDKGISLQPDFILGASGTDLGYFNAPRDIAVAPDGSLYVADSRNHRIQHFDAEGNFLDAFGSFGTIDDGTAGNGKLNEPWGVAVAEDGSIFVADTWNHRVQKFSPDGEFQTTWGYFNQSTDDPYAMWGPRDIAIDSNGNVLVTDTGNKRILVYDQEGNYLTQFGGQGFAAGEFDEPVGLAVDPESGLVYVADTWNQRVQAFQVDAFNFYTPVNAWDIIGWYGQSLDNKPYLDARNGQVFVVDPEYPRVLVFSGDGQFNYYWGEDIASLGIASSVAVDQQGRAWVSDATNQQILHFTLP